MEKIRKKVGTKEIITFPAIPKFRLPGKNTVNEVIDSAEQIEEQVDN